MVLVAVGLGLRVSEAVALQWIDFDFKNRKVTIRRAYTHSALKETNKTNVIGSVRFAGRFQSHFRSQITPAWI